MRTLLLNVCPFLEPDRWVSQVFGQGAGTPVPSTVPMDAYRDGEDYVVEFDLPGVDPSAIELSIERHVLTLRAHRDSAVPDGTEMQVAERLSGTWTRQLTLGEALDLERVEAHYADGVLRLRFPVKADAQPRKIEVAAGSEGRQLTG